MCLRSLNLNTNVNKRSVWIIFAVKWLLMFTCMITNSHAQPLPSRRGCCNILMVTSFYSLHYKCVKIHWIPQTFFFIVYWLFDDHKHNMIAHFQHREGKWTCNGSSYSIQEEHLCLLLIHYVCLSHHVSVSDRILVDKYTGREANIHIQWSWRYEIYFFVFLNKNK